jgi:hypothetical protein
MKKIASLILAASIAAIMSTGAAEAGWNKRGWYLKRPGANCVMRKIATFESNGKVVARKVRVCR